jgi:hypothetical protein
MNEPKVKAKLATGAADGATVPVDPVDAQLRAMFQHVATQPTPDPLLRLINELEATRPMSPNESRSFEE